HLRTDPDLSRHVTQLRKRLDAKTKADLKSLALNTPAWMRPVLQQIIQPLAHGLRSPTDATTAVTKFNAASAESPNCVRRFAKGMSDSLSSFRSMITCAKPSSGGAIVS